MYPHLQVGPEVADVLGPDAITQIRDATAFLAYICAICQAVARFGNLGNPAAVIAWRYLPAGITQVQFAHASCSPSTILTVNAHPVLTGTLACLSLWLTATPSGGQVTVITTAAEDPTPASASHPGTISRQSRAA
jgi:hypothetical protein